MACWGWVWFHRMHNLRLGDFPDIQRWFATMAERPAVVRALSVGLDNVSDELRLLFNAPYYIPPEERGQ